MNYLFYKLNDAEGYANKAGGLFGAYAERSHIAADKVEDFAGLGMKDSKLNVKDAGRYLSASALRSITNVGTAERYLGAGAKHCKIYADEAGYGAGFQSIDTEIYIGSKKIQPAGTQVLH